MLNWQVESFYSFCFLSKKSKTSCLLNGSHGICSWTYCIYDQGLKQPKVGPQIISTMIGLIFITYRKISANSPNTFLSLQSNGGSHFPLNHPHVICHIYLSSHGFISQMTGLGLTEHKWLIYGHSIKKWWDLLIAVILLMYTDLFSINCYLLIYRSNRNFAHCKSKIKVILETFFSDGKRMMYSKLITHNIHRSWKWERDNIIVQSVRTMPWHRYFYSRKMALTYNQCDKI